MPCLELFKTNVSMDVYKKLSRGEKKKKNELNIFFFQNSRRRCNSLVPSLAGAFEYNSIPPLQYLRIFKNFTFNKMFRFNI